MEMEFTDSNFDQEVLKSDKLTLVYFWAPWCGPCQAMGLTIKDLAKKFEGKAGIGKCNVDENNEYSEKFEIMSVPAIKIFKDGNIIKELVGLQSAIVLEKALEELM